MKKRLLLSFMICFVLFFCSSYAGAVYILSASKCFGFFAEDTTEANELVFQAEKMFVEMDRLFKKNSEVKNPVIVKYSESGEGSEFNMAFKGYRITFFSDKTPENNYQALSELCATAYFMVESGLEDTEFRIGPNPVPYWIYAGAASYMIYKQRYGVWKFVQEEYNKGMLDFTVLFSDAGREAKIEPVAAGLLFGYINSDKKRRDLFLEFVSLTVNGVKVDTAYKNTLFKVFGPASNLISDFLIVVDEKISVSLFELMYDEEETCEKLIGIIYTDPDRLGLESEGKLTLKQLYPFLERNDVKKLVAEKSVAIKELAIRSHMRYKDLVIMFDSVIDSMLRGDRESFNRYFHSADNKAGKMIGSEYKVKKAKIRFSDVRAAKQDSD